MDPRTIVAGLSCWHGPVDPQPISGGITNLNFSVVDRGQRYFVRIGDDIPEHGIVRSNELAANRAAHAAGVSPAVIHSQPGALVLEFIPGRTFSPADARDPGNLDRIVDLLKRCHRDIPGQLRGATPMFSVFQVVRDYARTLTAGGSRHCPALPRLLDTAARLEKALGPGRHGLRSQRPARDQLHRRRHAPVAGRLGICGIQLAVVRPRGTGVEQRIPGRELRNRMLELYFGSRPDDRLGLRFAAMTAASLLRETMWSMVSEIHSKVDFDYRAYTAENLARFEAALAAFDELDDQ